MSALLVDLGTWPAATAIGVLAQNPAPPPGKGEEFGKASPIALVVIILLGIATILLIRSMTRRIKRLPESFDRGAADRDATRPDGGSAEPGPDAGKRQEEGGGGSRPDGADAAARAQGGDAEDRRG